MELRRLSSNLSVSPQISVADIPALKQSGFRSVICNRPDGEEPGQTSFAEIEAAAGAAGLRAYYLPVISGGVEPKDAAAFGQALAELPGPVLAYCRSGARSAALWAGCQAMGAGQASAGDTARP